jgi:histidine triad (HIT) family protein
MSDCVFCEIIRTEIAEGFIRYENVVSFTPLNPVGEGHRLYIPVEHSENAADAWAAGDAAIAFIAACNWALRHDQDFNIITSGGKYATQTVFHTHIHYVPRRESDGLRLPWSK